jgi:hypothetical protein
VGCWLCPEIEGSQVLAVSIDFNVMHSANFEC